MNKIRDTVHKGCIDIHSSTNDVYGADETFISSGSMGCLAGDPCRGIDESEMRRAGLTCSRAVCTVIYGESAEGSTAQHSARNLETFLFLSCPFPFVNKLDRHGL